MDTPARIRCKFIVESIEDNTPVAVGAPAEKPATPTSVVVKARASWDEDPESRQFAKATPWGVLRFAVDNPTALAAFLPGGPFTPGRSFYLDLVPTE